MKLPDWFPKVPPPFNPVFRQTWEVMDDNAKRWLFLFDMVVFIAVMAFLFWACSR